MNSGHTVVIGGTRGVGRAIVHAIAAEGHVVSVIGRRAPSDSDRNLPNVHYWALDLLDEPRLETAWPEILGRNGKINNLVFSQRYRGEEDEWAGEIEMELTVTKNVIDQLAGQFDPVSGGSIVIVSSIAGEFITEEQPLSYHVAKAGLNQLVRYYAVALGRKTIRVNCVSSGAVIKEESRQFYEDNHQIYDLYDSITPLGRMATSEDIANAAVFLCGPKANYITGQNIVVDGGLSLHWHQSLARKLTSLDHISTTRRNKTHQVDRRP
jgi:hypothetical protein